MWSWGCDLKECLLTTHKALELTDSDKQREGQGRINSESLSQARVGKEAGCKQARPGRKQQVAHSNDQACCFGRRVRKPVLGLHLLFTFKPVSKRNYCS